MVKFIIYKITNNKTGKSYIGRTNNLKARIIAHRLKNSPCAYLSRAIHKYGWENFSVEILEEVQEFENACIREGALIKEHKTLAPDGYNLISEGASGRSPVAETRKKMSRAQQGCKRGNSKYFGVGRRKNRYRFRLSVTKDGERLEISGAEGSEEDAAKSYDKLALYFHGKSATLNFEESRSLSNGDVKSFFRELQKKKKQSSTAEGVSLHKLTGKWRAYFYDNGKQVDLGLFETEKEAIKARKNGIKKYFKEN